MQYSTNKLALAGVLSSALIIILSYSLHELIDSRVENWRLILNLGQYFVVLAGIVVAGRILRNDVPQPYLVSTVAVLLSWSTSFLLSVTRLVASNAPEGFHLAIQIPLSLLIASVMFYVSNKFLNHLSISKFKKVSMAIVLVFIWTMVCAMARLLIDRLVATQLLE